MRDNLEIMSTDENAKNDAAGCGLGLYAILLLVLFLAGVGGMIGGTIGLLNSEPLEARNLVHGSEVQVWRLQPMRDAGLLALTEVPAAWHDESPRFDGMTACAITPKGVGKVDNGKHWFTEWKDVTDAVPKPTEDGRVGVVISSNDSSFACYFGVGEGADRFLRQIAAERQEPSSE